MIERVAQYILNEQLIPEKKIKIYAAVSGGVDSVVLLDILYHLRNRFGFDLEILHFNHQVRGKFSDRDADFVEKLAVSYNLKIHLGKLEYVPKNVTETFLREKRYQFFKKFLLKERGILLATGHHHDDNLETFIMRLAKGSRLRGLLSILPKRGCFIKPLLKQSKQDILTYAEMHHLQFRQDDTNNDNRIHRNKIRNQILPYLQHELNKDIKVNIQKSIDDFFEYYYLFEYVLQKAIAHSVKKSKSLLILNRKHYRTYITLIRRGLVEYCISDSNPLNYSLSKRKFKNWDTFICDSSPGKRFNYMENGTALSERNTIVFGELRSDRTEWFQLLPGREVLIDSRYKICMNPVTAHEVHYTENPNIEFVDSDLCGSRLFVRFWQKGDRFKPLGMKHRRKLSDFFTDLKLSIRLKKEIPLICKKDRIIWIAGYRLDDRFKITEKTRNYYRLELKVLEQ